jgi:hypothetical protein
MQGRSFCDLLDLPVAPVISVTSVKYLDTDGVEQTLASSVYELVNTGLEPQIRLKINQTFPVDPLRFGCRESDRSRRLFDGSGADPRRNPAHHFKLVRQPQRRAGSRRGLLAPFQLPPLLTKESPHMADLIDYRCKRSPRHGCKDCRRHRRSLSDRRSGGLSRQFRELLQARRLQQRDRCRALSRGHCASCGRDGPASCRRYGGSR